MTVSFTGLSSLHVAPGSPVRVWLNGTELPCLPEPRNWCSKCRIHAANDKLCPVCLDEEGHAK